MMELIVIDVGRGRLYKHNDFYGVRMFSSSDFLGLGFE